MFRALAVAEWGVCSLFKAYLKEGNHMGLESMCFLETVSECALGVCLYRQSCNSNKSQMPVSFAHVNGPVHFDP